LGGSGGNAEREEKNRREGWRKRLPGLPFMSPHISDSKRYRSDVRSEGKKLRHVKLRKEKKKD